jgi:hypothetical protein
MITGVGSVMRILKRKSKAGMGIYRKQWYFQGMFAQLFHVLERGEGWHLCVIVEAT